MHNWITCRSGVRLTVDDPKEDQIFLDDIAYGTARKARFAGQSKWFVSVAQHQTTGARYFLDQGCKLYAKAFLIHDGSEAYFNDLPTPLKVQCPDYIKREDALQQVIFAKFNVPWTAMSGIHGVDKQLAQEEGLLNYPGVDLPWVDAGRTIQIYAGIKAPTFLRRIYDRVRVHFGFRPTSWLDPETARIDYLNCFKEVFGHAM